MPRRCAVHLNALSTHPVVDSSHAPPAAAAAANTDFLQLLTSQANARASSNCKTTSTTITRAHISEALEELGFGHLVETSESTEQVAAARKPKRKRDNGANPSGLSEEELLKMQQELFANARQAQTG